MGGGEWRWGKKKWDLSLDSLISHVGRGSFRCYAILAITNSGPSARQYSTCTALYILNDILGL